MLQRTEIYIPQHTFSMFRTRDEAFQLIERLWKITMARLLKWAEVENQTDQNYDTLKNFVMTAIADEDVLSKSRGFLSSSHVCTNTLELLTNNHFGCLPGLVTE
jgi:hypothetical protein